MVRFGVWQCGKLRPCDNGRSSLHNLAAELFERLTVESADFPARAAALYAELMGDSMSFAFTLGAEDVQAAYRRQIRGGGFIQYIHAIVSEAEGDQYIVNS